MMPQAGSPDFGESRRKRSASVRALAPGAMGLPALPRLALHLHRKDAELEPVAARLGEILLQSASGSLPDTAQAYPLNDAP